MHTSVVKSLSNLLGGCYSPLIWVRKWGQMLVVFVKHALLPFTTDAEWEFIPSEVVARPARTKGAIAAAFRIFHTTFLIVGCHLSCECSLQSFTRIADRTKGERVVDYHKICQHLRFDHFTVKHKLSAVSDIDRVVWMGDLNFRAVDHRVVDRLFNAAADGLGSNVVLAQDQLIHEMKLGTFDFEILKTVKKPSSSASRRRRSPSVPHTNTCVIVTTTSTT